MKKRVNQKEVKIRLAVASELPEIQSMVNAEYEEARYTLGVIGSDQVIKLDRWNMLLVCTVDKEIVGFQHITCGAEPPKVTLSGILIKKDYRGYGYGRKLIKEAIKLGTLAWDCDYIHSQTIDYKNDRSIYKILKSLGFKRSGTVKNMHKINGIYYSQSFWDLKRK